MKKITVFVLTTIVLLSCKNQQPSDRSEGVQKPVIGTWKLLQATIIENGDTAVTDYTKNVSFIKIINETHFAFLQHDLARGKDSAANFVAGGGRYSLKDSLYTEHLEYCSAREWEGHDFNFAITIQEDTLIQQGIERVESAGINRVNTEKYIRVKSQVSSSGG
ncbi:MAG TPA: hypothetical protein VGN63_05755 [Flavisolibacter sp.]|jgi:hypothetical protein|nr:hypothetical protein [Flavisolibacter sp.]